MSDDACPNFHGPDGIIECWAPGGPCDVPNDPACDCCGECEWCRLAAAEPAEVSS